MKKLLLKMMLVFCMGVMVNMNTASAQHFDYDEAYQILQGKWVDTETNQELTLVWKSYDGSECNIINGQGYTDPEGESSIYIDRKGAVCDVYVTYNADEERYYGKLVRVNTQTGKTHVLNNSLVRSN